MVEHCAVFPMGCSRIMYYERETANECLPGEKSSFHNCISNIILTVKINKTKKQVGNMPNHGQGASG